MQSNDTTAGVSRFTWRKRYIVVGICLFFLSGGVWFWFGSRKLTSQEQVFVGRWQVTATSQLNLFPHYVDVWVIKPDRTLQILRDDPNSPGNLIVHFDCNWKVRNNQLVVDHHPPRNVRDYVHRLQEIVLSAGQFKQVPSHRTLYDVKSSDAGQHVLWILQTRKPLSYEVRDLVPLTE